MAKRHNIRYPSHYGFAGEDAQIPPPVQGSPCSPIQQMPPDWFCYDHDLDGVGIAMPRKAAGRMVGGAGVLGLVVLGGVVLAGIKSDWSRK